MQEAMIYSFYSTAVTEKVGKQWKSTFEYKKKKATQMQNNTATTAIQYCYSYFFTNLCVQHSIAGTHRTLVKTKICANEK